jgi:hypothetical protein
MRSTVPTLVSLAASLLFLAPACSGAQTVALGGGDGGPANSGSGSGGSGGGSGSSSGAVPQDAGTVVDSGPGTPDSSATVDSSEPMDVAPVEEPPPTGPAVQCPMNGQPASCQPGDYCCVTGNPMQGNQTFDCQHGSSSCTGTKVHCTVPSDCPSGEICCGSETTTTTGTTYTEVTCAAACAGTNQRIFCDPSAQTSPCPMQTPNCAPSQLLPGYDVCQM